MKRTFHTIVSSLLVWEILGREGRITYGDRVRSTGIDVVHVETAIRTAARNHAAVRRPAATHDARLTARGKE